MDQKANLQQLLHYQTNQSHLYKHFNLCYCLVHIIEEHACTNTHKNTEKHAYAFVETLLQGY